MESFITVAVQVLLYGILVDGEQYHYIGQSNSQLKNRTAMLIRAETHEQVCFALVSPHFQEKQRIILDSSHAQ